MNIFKRILSIFCLVLLVGALLALSSCGGGETAEKDITGVEFKDLEVAYDGTEKAIAVTGTLPEGVTVSYTKNKGTIPGVYNATATLTGEGYKTLTLNAKLTIQLGNIEGITFAGGTYTYDGTEKKVEITGTLPEGVTVSYESNTGTNAGTYSAKATLSGEYYNTKVLNTTLKIDPAKIEGITFEGATVVYDGTEKKIEIAGTLPEGVTVAYENNVATDAGTYIAKATVTGANYEKLELNAVLEITKADITGVSFEGASFTYDGTEKKVEITGTLPEGVTVSYEGNTGTNADVYTAKATLTGANYNPLTLTATLEIKKADITDITFTGATYEYDGNEKTIEIVGTLPEGVTVSYTGNKGTNVGNYPATAVISGANYNTLTLNATLVITEPTPPPKQDITGVTLKDGEFTYDGTVKSIAVEGTLPEGVSVDYKVTGNATDAGTYPVVATLTGEGYNELVLQANIVIKKADITGITFANGEFVYDGAEKTITVTGELPTGVQVQYGANKATTVGVYNATAVLSGANYNTLTLTATLPLTTADINTPNVEGITLPDKEFNYNGEKHYLEISGTLPEGVTVTYENNGKTYAGTYIVTVTITGENYNTLVLTATLTIKPTSEGGLV
ncbi:MAG: hypothetical protein IJY24_05405, partial [Clostridia bacterium]|nr:hypothetical protein [Clostridia bacterium]